MFFCYVDESGDCGYYDSQMPDKSGSPYFILAGLVINDENWKMALDLFKGYRKKIASQAYLPYDVEFHCSDMIDPHKIKQYSQISIKDRWMLIEKFSEIIGQQNSFSVIAVVIDKTKSGLLPADYQTTARTKLYQAYDQFLKEKKEHGIVLFDRANEKIINTHVRKLMGTGSSGITVPGIRIGWVIEDPIFRISTDSIFIQAADVIAFTLKEKEFPQSSRKKFNADRIFGNKLGAICYKSMVAGVDGIVRA